MAEMDARLAQLHEQLDSIDCSTFLPGPQPRTIDPGSTTLGTRVHRRDPAALLQRLQTFRPSTWFGKPDSLCAPACAARGWCNTGHDLLTCEYCGRKLSCKLPANLASSAGAALVAKYTSSLSSSHEAACPWATFTVDPCQPSFPVSSNVRLAADFHTRQQGLVALDRVPPVAATTPGSLLSAITTPAAAGDGGVVAAGGAAREGGGSSGRTTAAEAAGALSSALADLLHLQPQQLAAAAAPSNSSSSSRGQVVLLRPQQVAPLLSLLGWQVQQLLPAGSNAGPSTGASHPSILPHLITRAPSPDLQHQQQQVVAANCCLSCGLCGAKVPLWSYCKTGPLYLTTLARQAAAQGMLQGASHLTASAIGAAAGVGAAGGGGGAAAGAAEAAGDPMGTPPAGAGGRMQAPRSSSLPPLPPSHQPLHRGPSPQPSSTPTAAAAAGGGGGAAAAGGGSGRPGTPGASGSPTAAVAIAMHQTIAGGALVSPRVSPTAAAAAAGPFGAHPAPSFADAAAGADDGGEDGADAGELPAFGLAALAAQESAARRRSGSPGVTQVGSPGDGSGAARAPPGKRGREEGGVASPGAAHTGPPEGGPDAAGVAAAGHGGGSSASSSKRPRRSFSPLDSSAVQSALGLADAPRPCSAVPASALLQQPSLLGPAAVADAELSTEGVDGLTAAGVDLFDPVGAHRSWCPWVVTPGSPSSSFLTAAAAMDGSQGGGSRGGGSSSRRGQFKLEQLQLAGAPGWVQALVAVAQQAAAFSSGGRAGAGGGRGGAGVGGGGGVGGAQQQQEEEDDSGQVMARASWVLHALGDV